MVNLNIKLPAYLELFYTAWTDFFVFRKPRKFNCFSKNKSVMIIGLIRFAMRKKSQKDGRFCTNQSFLKFVLRRGLNTEMSKTIFFSIG